MTHFAAKRPGAGAHLDAPGNGALTHG